MSSHKFQRKDSFSQYTASLPAVTLLILALLSAAPVWGPGIVNTRAGGDSPFLLWRTQQMAVNLRAGVFPVRWMPDAAYGYGYPFFSYMAVLPFYIAASLNIVGLDILTAIKLTQTLGFIASAFAMYGWTRRRLSQTGAWLAAVAYTFSAYHLVNVYTRGDSLHEFYAFVFYPLILWALDLTFERRDARSVAMLALAYAGLPIAHNLSTAIFTPFALLYAIILGLHLRPPALRASNLQPLTSNLQPPTSDLRPPTSRPFGIQPQLLNLLPCAIGLGLGLALSAWVWLPAIGETSYVQFGEQTTGYFNYSNHFRRADLVQPTLAFDYDVNKTTPFAVSSAQAALASLGVIAIVARAIRARKLEMLPAFTLTGLLISTVMITPLSKPLWDHLPLLLLVQFPWRFLSAQSLFTALATAQVFFHEEHKGTRRILGVSLCPSWMNWATWIGAAAFGLLLATTALANLRPSRLYISPADVTTERLQLYEMFTANIGTTIRYEYLPRQVVPRLYTSDALIEPGQPMRAVALEGDAVTSRQDAAPTRQTWRVKAGASGATVALPLLWWPGWQATADGKSTPIRPAQSSGRITLDLTPGEHIVALSLGRTPLRTVAESVSLIAAIVLIMLFVFFNRQDIKTQSPINRVSSRLRVLVAKHGVTTLLVILVLGIGLATFVARSGSAADRVNETMDFYSQPYLHNNPTGVQFGSGLRLMAYDLSADKLQAGQTLDVILKWLNSGGSQPVTVTLVSPAQHLPQFDGAPTIAQSVEPIPANATTQTAPTVHSLMISSETPRGVYLVKVQAGNNMTYLRPVRVYNETPIGDAPVIAQFDNGRIRLHRVRAEQVTPAQLAVTLDWSAARPVEANYASRVRLYTAAGDVATSTDLQPGYGFLPTSRWRTGELVTDRYTLKLPEGTPPGDDYGIEVLLYDAATLAGAGDLYVQPNIALTLFSRRPIDSPTLARFGPELALTTLDVPSKHEQGAPTLTIKAGWLATAAQSADRIARWAIYDSKGALVFTQTTELAAGARSSLWPAGAYVVGQMQLNMPRGLDAGLYRLGVTALNRKTQSEEGNFLASSPFEIVGHSRSMTIPPLQHRSDVEFGQQIRLLGYDVQSQISSIKSQKTQIKLTLYWQATAAPLDDYKVFVHLFDPNGAGIPVAQHDAMPLAGHYPTSWWIAGEVVSDTVTLTLTDVKPGMYRLAVGLYDPQTVTRLVAVGPDGARLDADRAVLPETITMPK